MKTLRWLSVLILVGCATGPKPATSTTPSTSPQTPPAAASSCDAHQAEISSEADTRATPWNVTQHLAKNFPDGQVSWLMKDAGYQNYVVKTAAKNWGRCDDTGCYVFVAPAAVIHNAVAQSMSSGHHDPALIGKALGLPAANFEGPLRMMTLDTAKVSVCT